MIHTCLTAVTWIDYRTENQMGISLAAQNRRLDSTTIGEMRTHGVPASQETSFLRLGLDRIIDLIRNPVPSDTTN